VAREEGGGAGFVFVFSRRRGGELLAVGFRSSYSYVSFSFSFGDGGESRWRLRAPRLGVPAPPRRDVYVRVVQNALEVLEVEPGDAGGERHRQDARIRRREVDHLVEQAVAQRTDVEVTSGRGAIGASRPASAPPTPVS
jgi:hypothetical protein